MTQPVRTATVEPADTIPAAPDADDATYDPFAAPPEDTGEAAELPDTRSTGARLADAQREAETMRAVAQSNKRHVAYLVEAYEQLEDDRRRLLAALDADPNTRVTELAEQLRRSLDRRDALTAENACLRQLSPEAHRTHP